MFRNYRLSRSECVLLIYADRVYFKIFLLLFWFFFFLVYAFFNRKVDSMRHVLAATSLRVIRDSIRDGDERISIVQCLNSVNALLEIEFYKRDDAFFFFFFR